VVDTTRTHWTIDEELLERFVKGEISADRRQLLEEHLKGCEQCRARVEEERTISLAIRAAGRAELRRDLADRLSRRFTSDTYGVWRWMAVAAVLVAAVGIWRLLLPVTPVPSGHEAPPTIAEEPKHASSETARPSEPPSSAPPAVERSGQGGRAGRSEIAIPSDEPLTVPPAADAVARTAEASAEITPEAVDRAAAAKKAGAEEGPTIEALHETWVQATILTPPVQNAKTMARAAADERAKDAGEVPQAAHQGVAMRGPLPMQLRQNPRSNLPEEQLRRNPPAPETVPVRISMVGDSLLIELFPPAPYPEGDLRRALFNRPKADSIVISVGRHLLGMRIPGNFLAQ
jgi:anti-sigma factor RsiW